MFLRILDNFIRIRFRTFRLQGRRGWGREWERRNGFSIISPFPSPPPYIFFTLSEGLEPTAYTAEPFKIQQVVKTKSSKFRGVEIKPFKSMTSPCKYLWIWLVLSWFCIIWSQKPLTRRVSERSTPALGLWQGLSRHQSILWPILEYFIPREQGLYSFKWLIANINCKKKKKKKRKEM